MNWCENVILLAVTDSTNNYAMRLIDADKAQAGTLIVAERQEAGKGQRGRQWQDQAGDSLLMSLILTPQWPVSQQFAFSSAVALGVAQLAAQLLPAQRVAIKWPNDLILNDKKAGGILIENVLRGSQWTYAVAGIGINVHQTRFPQLPHATSLGRHGAPPQDLTLLAVQLRQLIRQWLGIADPHFLLLKYNELLYKRQAWQDFQTPEGLLSCWIEGVGPDGRLQLRLPDGSEKLLWHGEWEWAW